MRTVSCARVVRDGTCGRDQVSSHVFQAEPVATPSELALRRRCLLEESAGRGLLKLSTCEFLRLPQGVGGPTSDAAPGDTLPVTVRRHPQNGLVPLGTMASPQAAVRNYF